MNKKKNISIYNTLAGKASVAFCAIDGKVWMIQNQQAELFDTSKSNINMHRSNTLKEGGLDVNSVVKDSFTTASEILLPIADAGKKDMALTSWKGAVMRNQDIENSKAKYKH